MLKRLSPNSDDPERYQDEVHGRTYQRVVGGLAWPAKESPGFLAVLAQDYEPDASGHYHYWVLAERESADLGNLIRYAIDMRQEYLVKTWVGNVNNKPAMYFLGELMQPYNYKERLSLDMAPHASDPQGLSFYLPLIKEHTANQKLLHFGDSRLPGYLSQVRAEDLSRAPEDFPPIAALGYALAELYSWRGNMANYQPVSYADRVNAWML